MKTEELGKSKVLNLLFKPAGMLMGSRARKWLMPPENTLKAASVSSGQHVLEVGCGTGFFTIPLARMVGADGQVIALDASAGFTEVVINKVQNAGFNNVTVLRRDALNTGLDSDSIDKSLLLGVIPFPLLPLEKLLPEMHRVLKPEGCMSIWLFPPLIHNWVPKVIATSGYFTAINKQGRVYNYARISLTVDDV
ncbi:MAG: class I SAM-dependent methyltransferase [Desulfocapsaceae bacterium]